mgnify:CR=1 FL=1
MKSLYSVGLFLFACQILEDGQYDLFYFIEQQYYFMNLRIRHQILR